ncbi:MAG TPA: twin-arginine translocase TatA/TatE family subunit [Tepidisphaeraceae bacterium]
MNILALGMPGPFELILLTGLGLLFFGRRLPEVGRSIGQTIVQFKKGLNEVKDEVSTTESKPLLTDAPAPRFDPQTGEPIKS